MNRSIRRICLPLFAFAALFAAKVDASPRHKEPANYGHLVKHDTAAHRKVVIHEKTRHVNVTNGEVVLFEVNGKRFTFAFNAWPNDSSVPLSVIAPKDVELPDVRVYIAPSPYTQG
jgi:hypothetical protein